MKKILILGGSHRDIPLINAAQGLGFFVITLGDKDYYLGHNYSNKALKINFNDLETVKKVILDEKIDYLIPGSGEESYLNTVQLSQELNIGNYDTLEIAQLVHNKWKFKQFCLENSISTPKGYFYSSDSYLEDLNFPIVVKPANLSGGRGVEVVNNHSELQISLKKAKKVSDEIFLEEFIDGELIAYSIFLKNQKILYGFTGKDDTYLNKYLITTAYPIQLNNIILKKLNQDIEKLSKLLHLVDGMFHLQIIIKNNIPYIIDVTRRVPGDLYPNLIEYCDKVAYSKAVVKSYIGKEIKNEFGTSENNEFVIRHCVMPSSNGIYSDLFIHTSLEKNIINRFDLESYGLNINNYLHTQLAIIFIKVPKENKNIVNDINNLIYPIVK